MLAAARKRPPTLRVPGDTAEATSDIESSDSSVSPEQEQSTVAQPTSSSGSLSLGRSVLKKLSTTQSATNKNSLLRSLSFSRRNKRSKRVVVNLAHAGADVIVTSETSDNAPAEDKKEAADEKATKTMVVLEDGLEIVDDREAEVICSATTSRTTSPLNKGVESDAAWPEPASSPPPYRRSRTTTTTTTVTTTTNNDAAGASTLSDGLAACVRKALSTELCRLQDQLDTLMSDPPDEHDDFLSAIKSLTRRLGWLRSDLDILVPKVRDSGAEPDAAGRDDSSTGSLASLLAIAAGAEEFALSLRREAQAAERAQAERKAVESLCATAGMRVAPVPHDGDCLYACAHKWLQTMQVASEEVAVAAAPCDENEEAACGENTVTAAPADSISDVAPGSAAAMVARECESADDVRALVCDMMRERSGGDETERAGHVDTGLLETMRTAVLSAACGTATDGTSVAMRSALARRSGGTAHDVNALDATVCRDVYLETMGRRGIYGERAEIETLAHLVGAPVHIYYHIAAASEEEGATVGGDVAASEGGAGDKAGHDSRLHAGGEATTTKTATAMLRPQEMVSPPDVDANAEPLRLLHLIHERHFDLLLPTVVAV